MEERPNHSRAIVREALSVWALSFAGLVAARLVGFVIPWVAGQVKAVAAALFLYLPGTLLKRRGEHLEDYGVPDWPWASREAAAQFRKDVVWALGVSAIVFPLTVGGFFLLLDAISWLPGSWREILTPYPHGAGDIALRFPDRFWLHVLDQFLVVALPEEFFYRGYLQTRLEHAWGKGKGRLLGAPVGKAFWLTQVLFAVGHLGRLDPWRLSVFFPSILFGWLRARTGSIVPGIIVHALSNLVLMVLEASAFG